MNNERLMQKGRLADAKAQRDELLLELTMLRDSIREHLDPFREMIDLDLREVRILFTRLEERHADLRKQQDLIDRLEEALNG